MKKTGKILIALFAVLLLLGSFTVASFASDEVTIPETPTGIQKFFNDFITLRENGGLVTKVFGTVSEGTANGNTVLLYEPNFLSYGLTLLLMAVASYVLGSINFGVIVSKKMCNDDVRKHGSGNAGMTNMARVYGMKPAFVTFAGDAGKAALVALLGIILGGNGCGYLAVAFCMIGHAFPCFFGFKGGKSVSSACGAILVLEPIAFLLLMVCFVTIVATTRYVSLGSVMSASLIPIVVNGVWSIGLFHNMRTSPDYFIVVICTVFYACFIVWLHRANLKRLAAGNENKADFLFKKKEKN